MIRTVTIGTTTIQGPADDMPVPFDPNNHAPNARCDICGKPLCLADPAFDLRCCDSCNGERFAASHAPDPVVKPDWRQPTGHIALLARLRDTRAWLAPEDIAAAADLIEAQAAEIHRLRGRA